MVIMAYLGHGLVHQVARSLFQPLQIRFLPGAQYATGLTSFKKRMVHLCRSLRARLVFLA